VGRVRAGTGQCAAGWCEILALNDAGNVTVVEQAGQRSDRSGYVSFEQRYNEGGAFVVGTPVITRTIRKAGRTFGRSR